MEGNSEVVWRGKRTKGRGEKDLRWRRRESYREMYFLLKGKTDEEREEN